LFPKLRFFLIQNVYLNFIKVRITGSKANIRMNKEDNNEIFDLQYLKKYANGDENFEKEIIGMFIEQFPKMLNQMRVAHKENNLKELYSIAHRSASHMNFIKVHKIVEDIEAIEKFSKDKTNLDDIPLLLNNIEEHANEAIQLLKEKI
jgi:HPt (histidine-containing phosphotransfer) domain-containing protein